MSSNKSHETRFQSQTQSRFIDDSNDIKFEDVEVLLQIYVDFLKEYKERVLFDLNQHKNTVPSDPLIWEAIHHILSKIASKTEVELSKSGTYSKCFKSYSCELSINKKNKDLEKFRDIVIHSVRRQKYPIIHIYTNDIVFRRWFNRNSMLPLYATKCLMEMCFCDIGTSLELEKKQNDKFMAKNEPNLQDVYKNCLFEMSQMLFYEMKRMSLCHTDTHYYKSDNQDCVQNQFPNQTIVYRGEKKSDEMLHDLKEKVKMLKFPTDWIVLHKKYCSTSLKESITQKFSSSCGLHRNKFVHRYHLIKPDSEEIDQFSLLFPSHHIICLALQIKDYSAFKEYEVLLWHPNGLTLGYSQIEERFWYVDHVTTCLQLLDKRTYQEIKEQNSDYDKALELSRSGGENALSDHYRRYPQQRAIHYFEFLCHMTCYQFSADHYRKKLENGTSDSMNNIIKWYKEKLNFIKDIQKVENTLEEN